MRMSKRLRGAALIGASVVAGLGVVSSASADVGYDFQPAQSFTLSGPGRPRAAAIRTST